jgi:hypothetical protein
VKRFLALLAFAYPSSFRTCFGAEVVDHAVEECERAFERGLLAGLSCIVATGARRASRVDPILSMRGS